MQCVDFERIWQDRLDARDVASATVAPQQHELDAHVAECPACRQLAHRYQVLQHALRTLGPPPSPSPEVLSRILRTHEYDRQAIRRKSNIRRILSPLALAASVLLMVAVVWRTPPEAPGPGRDAGTVVGTDGRGVAVGEPPLLTDALATAGSATWELARATSAPAARLGREFFEVATFRGPLGGQGIDPAGTVPNGPTEALVSEGAGASQENVRSLPLTGTARHAFGFLLGPPSDSDDSTVAPAKSG